MELRWTNIAETTQQDLQTSTEPESRNENCKTEIVFSQNTTKEEIYNKMCSHIIVLPHQTL